MSTDASAQNASAQNKNERTITTNPLTLARWDDLVVVFGSGRGVCSQCWCMCWPDRPLMRLELPV